MSRAFRNNSTLSTKRNGLGTEQIRPLPLECFTFLYLSLPLMIFLGMELRLFVALPFYGIILYCLLGSSLFTWMSSPWKPWLDLSRKGKLLWLFSILLLLGLVWSSGSGHFTFARSDYEKHDAILKELVLNDWPIPFAHPDGMHGTVAYLHYYFGAYIVPAIIGKLTDFTTAVQSVYFWNSLGMLLVLAWLVSSMGKLPWWLLPAFIFFGGYDSWIRLFWGQGDNLSLLFSNPLEFVLALTKPLSNRLWEFDLRYPSNTAHLFWAPQHAIPAWILGGYIFNAINRAEVRPYDLLIFSLSSFWSPFAMLGLAPFFLLHLLMNGPKKIWWSKENLLGAIILLFFALFYCSSAFSQPYFFLLRKPEGVTILVSFLLVQIGPWFILSWPILWFGTIREKALFVLSFCFLAAIPIFIFGLANDWCKQVSTAPQLIAFILISRTVFYLYHRGRRKMPAIIYAILFLLSAPSGGMDLYHSLTTPATPIFSGGIDSLYEEYTAQYLAVPSSPFYRWLSRSPAAQGGSLRVKSWQILKQKHLKVWDDFFTGLPD